MRCGMNDQVRHAMDQSVSDHWPLARDPYLFNAHSNNRSERLHGNTLRQALVQGVSDHGLCALDVVIVRKIWI